MIRDLNTNRILCQNVVEASSLFGRMRGMLGRNFDDFDAMLFRRNNSIHMFFMKMTLDIVFLDNHDTVIHVRERLKPWRIAAEWGAANVLELPAGTIEKNGIAPGAKLDISVDTSV